MVLHSNPAFIPQVNNSFHRSTELNLLSFCPSFKHPQEKERHSLDIKRVLSFYLDRMKSFCKTNITLISFRKSSLDHKSLLLLTYLIDILFHTKRRLFTLTSRHKVKRM